MPGRHKVSNRRMGSAIGWGDAAHLQQVLSSDLDNAIRYTNATATAIYDCGERTSRR